MLLLLAAGIAVVAGTLAEWRRQTVSPDTTVRYACPMHPDVVAPAAERCPICGMALERVAPGAPHAEPAPPNAAESADVVSLAADTVSTLRGPPVAIREQDVTTPIRAPAFVDDSQHVIALMYRDEVAVLASDEPGTFTATSVPAAVAVRRRDEPPTPHDAATVLVRLDIAAASPLGRGTVGSIDFGPRARRVLVVPNAGVFDSPVGPYVLVASPDGRSFTKRRVQIGGTYATFAIVVSGVHATERVVVTDAFFIDAERRLRSQSPATGPSGAP